METKKKKEEKEDPRLALRAKKGLWLLIDPIIYINELLTN